MKPCEISAIYQPLDSSGSLQIAELLFEAFADDKAMAQLIGRELWDSIRKRYFQVQLGHPDIILVAKVEDRLVGVLTATSPDARFSFGTAIRQLITMRRLLGRHYAQSQRIADSIGDHLPGSPHIYINQLAVHPDFQGQSIGHDLVKRLVDIHPDSDLYVDCETSLQSFYGQHGFEIIGSVENTDLVVMSACS